MNYQQTAVNGTEGVYYTSPFLWVVKLTKLKPVVFQPRLLLDFPFFMHRQMPTSHKPPTILILWISLTVDAPLTGGHTCMRACTT